MRASEIRQHEKMKIQVQEMKIEDMFGKKTKGQGVPLSCIWRREDTVTENNIFQSLHSHTVFSITEFSIFFVKFKAAMEVCLSLNGPNNSYTIV